LEETENDGDDYLGSRTRRSEFIYSRAAGVDGRGAAGALNLAISTAYRYFRSLTQAGLLVPHTTGRYLLGPAIIQYDR
jgi:DNA-binding IclR family transcriptional regulator